MSNSPRACSCDAHQMTSCWGRAPIVHTCFRQGFPFRVFTFMAGTNLSPLKRGTVRGGAEPEGSSGTCGRRAFRSGNGGSSISRTRRAPPWTAEARVKRVPSRIEFDGATTLSLNNPKKNTQVSVARLATSKSCRYHSMLKLAS